MKKYTIIVDKIYFIFTAETKSLISTSNTDNQLDTTITVY